LNLISDILVSIFSFSNGSTCIPQYTEAAAEVSAEASTSSSASGGGGGGGGCGGLEGLLPATADPSAHRFPPGVEEALTARGAVFASAADAQQSGAAAASARTVANDGYLTTGKIPAAGEFRGAGSSSSSSAATAAGGIAGKHKSSSSSEAAAAAAADELTRLGPLLRDSEEGLATVRARAREFLANKVQGTFGVGLGSEENDGRGGVGAPEDAPATNVFHGWA
jgi:hypothetical protein